MRGRERDSRDRERKRKEKDVDNILDIHNPSRNDRHALSSSAQLPDQLPQSSSPDESMIDPESRFLKLLNSGVEIK